MQAQGREFEIFIIEQSSEHRFNRGALLNAAALLLQDSEHDYFVFHDVDTQPTKEGNIQYNFPTGPAPYHITPAELHPNALPDVTPRHALPGVIQKCPAICRCLSDVMPCQSQPSSNCDTLSDVTACNDLPGVMY
jgi:hypothetical protein